jgi:myo-inositol-1(or 4)-monophosphatase
MRDGDSSDLMALLTATADAVSAVLRAVDDWGLTGTRRGQYKADVLADDAALKVLRAAGVGVLSEESGLEGADRDVLVVVDPLDGSTNASRGVPWFATALCALDDSGPVAALVVNQASGVRYSATAGGGAWSGDRALRPSGAARLKGSYLGLNGYPPTWFGWGQYRTFGAAALDLCLVADGVLDGYVDCAPRSHGVWDYCASLLICREAGAACVDAFGRELVVRDPQERRTPVAAGTPELLAELVVARQAF